MVQPWQEKIMPCWQRRQPASNLSEISRADAWNELAPKESSWSRSLFGGADYLLRKIRLFSLVLKLGDVWSTRVYADRQVVRWTNKWCVAVTLQCFWFLKFRFLDQNIDRDAVWLKCRLAEALDDSGRTSGRKRVKRLFRFQAEGASIDVIDFFFPPFASAFSEPHERQADRPRSRKIANCLDWWLICKSSFFLVEPSSRERNQSCVWTMRRLIWSWKIFFVH